MTLYSTCFVIMQLVLMVTADLVCRETGDSVFDTAQQSCQHSAEKLRNVLEDHVLQLKKIISSSAYPDQKSVAPGKATDCSEIFSGSTDKSGVYLISPDGRCPFRAYCDMTDGGWTVIQRRIDGAVNFYRTWDEYVEGFGDVDGEYWLGLENIHRLTKDGYEIYFDIENYDGTRDYAHYKSFTVHEATTLYKMNVDAFGYKGSLKEHFSYHDNQKFSASDRDNDAYSTAHCAQSHTSGWWFKNCYQFGNFNGVFGNNDSIGLNYYNKAYVPIKKISIKVKAKVGFC